MKSLIAGQNTVIYIFTYYYVVCAALGRKISQMIIISFYFMQSYLSHRGCKPNHQIQDNDILSIKKISKIEQRHIPSNSYQHRQALRRWTCNTKLQSSFLNNALQCLTKLSNEHLVNTSPTSCDDNKCTPIVSIEPKNTSTRHHSRRTFLQHHSSNIIVRKSHGIYYT